ncbi:GFA family protein [Phenylobacterium sp.]|uniref:GFA family protein n=1 Tax=Phenylobacterium sp. TaxID=1871053 RepID=UPI003BACF6C2
MIRGSCCCGAVRFKLSAPPRLMGVCHCGRCRKAGSSAFVFVRRETFRWVAGEELVAVYAPEAPFKHARRFCRRCGSSLGEAGADADAFPIAAHSLDDDPGVRIRFHEFVAEKPAWCEIADDAVRFEGHPFRP